MTVPAAPNPDGKPEARPDARQRRVFSLYGASAHRSRLIPPLWRITSLLKADRAAVLWVDDYGPGLVHVFCLLDLAQDPPRRHYERAPLDAARRTDVPGLLDLADASARPDVRRDPAVGSQLVVGLGDDGRRSWFLVVDAKGSRPPLTGDQLSTLMFSAGECRGVVLHRGIGSGATTDGSPGDEADASDERPARVEAETFAGASVLEDLKGRGEEGALRRRIMTRYHIARFLRLLAADDFAVDATALVSQISRLRDTVQGSGVDAADPEAKLWSAVLEHAERLTLAELARATLALGGVADQQQHWNGANDLFGLAYEAAMAAGDLAVAIDATRFRARVAGRLGHRAEAKLWYERAMDMATAARDSARRAEIVKEMSRRI